MANHLAIAATFAPGDDVLIEHPTYELLLATARYLGAQVQRFSRRFADGFRLDPEAVARAITPRTKLIIITNLHNPSSALTDHETLKPMAKRRGAWALKFWSMKFISKRCSKTRRARRFISAKNLS